MSAALARARPTSETVRARILAATNRLIIERGERFTIQDVVKEAGIALQTFYRSFNGKDDLLLAAIAELIRVGCEQFRAQAASTADPLERLRSHIDSVIGGLHHASDGGASARFVASQRIRLAGLFPAPAALAEQPFVDLIEEELAAANRSGQAHSTDPARDAYFITQLVLSTYRHDAFTAVVDATLADDVWRFCLRAVGATGGVLGAAVGQ